MRLLLDFLQTIIISCDLSLTTFCLLTIILSDSLLFPSKTQSVSLNPSDTVHVWYNNWFTYTTAIIKPYVSIQFYLFINQNIIIHEMFHAKNKRKQAGSSMNNRFSPPFTWSSSFLSSTLSATVGWFIWRAIKSSVSGSIFRWVLWLSDSNSVQFEIVM